MRSALLTPLVLGSFLAAPAAAATFQVGLKLNDPLPPTIHGTVGEVALTPDSAWAIYLADGDSETRVEFYRVPIEGGVVTKLYGTPAPFANLTDWSISPDSMHLLVRWSGFLPTKRLFSIPIGGGAAVELAPGNDVREYFITPDGATVVFGDFLNLMAVPTDASAAPISLDPGTDQLVPPFVTTPDGTQVLYRRSGELLVVPIDGSAAPVRLSPANPRQVSAFRVSPDGSRVAFVLDDSTGNFRREMWSAPIDGSAAAIEVSNPLVSQGHISAFDFEIDAASTYVVYLADQDQDGVDELYSAELTTRSSSVRLNGSLVMDGDVVDFAIDPAGARVVYRADQLEDELFSLFSVPIDGSQADTTLYAPPGSDVLDFLISPDAGFVLFRSLAPFVVQHVPIDGSAAAIVLTPGTVLPDPGYQILPDLSRMVFRALINQPEVVYQHHSVPLDGSQALTLLDYPPSFLDAPGSVEEFVLAPDGSRSVFRGDLDILQRCELYSVPPDRSTEPVRLSGDLAAGPEIGGAVYNNVTSPDGTRVVYQAEQLKDEAFELFSVASDRSSAPVRLNDPLPFRGGVFFDFTVTADSGSVIYRAIQETFDRIELYRVPIDGGVPNKLSGTTVANGFVLARFFLPPDESRVVFAADRVIDDVFELFSAPADGSGAPARLHAPLGGERDVFEWHMTADGTRMVFASDLAIDETVELYSAPVDASASAIKLNDPLVVGGDVFFGIQVASTGHVVFGADLETNDVTELYSVPVDGSGSQVKLSGSLVAGGDVVALFVSADGSLALYAADQVTDGVVELFGAPVDGSSAPIKLNGNLAVNGDVLSFASDPAGEWAVYRADQNADGVVELFSAATDGSASAERLHSSVGSVDVLDFEITAGGEHVIFLATLDGSGDYSLYSAPIDGSQPEKLLNPPLAPGRDVFGFELTSFGNVLYTSDQRANDRVEVFLVPEEGGFPARQMTPNFASFADAQTFANFTPPIQLSPTGDKVLYLADQETDGAIELFTTILRRSDRRQRGRTPVGTVDRSIPQTVEVEGGPKDLSSAPPVPLAPLAPRWQRRDATELLELAPRGAKAAFLEDESGIPRGQNVLRDHEELVRRGIHPTFEQRDPSGAPRLPPDAD